MSKRSRSTGGPANKISRQFAKRAEISENDLFSALPDDCLYSLFDHLDWSSYKTMRNVSQKMRSVSNNCDEPKKRAHSLVVSQDSNGHGVYLNFRDVQGITIEFSQLAYTIHKDSESGEITENRAARCGEFASDRWLWRSVIKTTRIPEQICSMIEQHSAEYEYKNLRIEHLYINQSFLDHVTANCCDNGTEQLEIVNCVFEKDLEKEKIAEFILSQKARNVNVFGSQINGVFDEQFLREYCADSDQCNLHVMVIDLNNWSPSADFVPLLLRFSILFLYNICLKPEDLITLIIKRLGSKKCHGHWNFSLTSMISDTHLVTMRGMKCIDNVNKSMFKIREEGGYTNIINENNKNLCTYNLVEFRGSFQASVSFYDPYFK